MVYPSIVVAHILHVLSVAIKPCTIGFFVTYWALGLPFLCWGAWATPGHPHAHPHFVFTAPPLADSAHGSHAAMATCDPAPMAGMHESARAAALVTTCQATTSNDQPTGQSLPSILVVSLFTLVFTPPFARELRLLVRRERAPAIHFPPGYPGSVPTPPPRLALA